jgi:hypothetical protein
MACFGSGSVHVDTLSLSLPRRRERLVYQCLSNCRQISVEKMRERGKSVMRCLLEPCSRH